jgi:hypothetical protein
MRAGSKPFQVESRLPLFVAKQAALQPLKPSLHPALAAAAIVMMYASMRQASLGCV